MKCLLNLSFLLLLLTSISSCKKNEKPEEPVPAKLIVEVVSRNEISATVKWTHTGTFNAATTLYRLTVGTVVTENLTGNSVFCAGLKPDEAYNGKLTAYNASGEMISAYFTIGRWSN